VAHVFSDKILDFDTMGVPKKATKKAKYPVKKGVTKYRKTNFKKDPASYTGPELKYVDVNSTLSPPIGSAFTVTGVQLNPLTAGSSSSGRIGIKTRVKSLLLRGVIVWPGGQTTIAPSQVRIVVVWDKQANTALATRTDVFQDGTYSISPTNMGNSERFVVLVDEWTDIGDNGQFNVSYQCYRKMDLESVYKDTSTVVPSTGAMLIFAAANNDSNDVVSTYQPKVEFYSRVRYTDV